MTMAQLDLLLNAESGVNAGQSQAQTRTETTNAGVTDALWLSSMKLGGG